jgi:hypothetical protein
VRQGDHIHEYALLGVKRTSRSASVMFANDPKRTYLIE